MGIDSGVGDASPNIFGCNIRLMGVAWKEST